MTQEGIKMTRIVMLAVAAWMFAGLTTVGVAPAMAADSFQSLLEADVAAVDAKLQLTGDVKTQADAIMQDGVTQRMAVLNSLGVVYGQKPSFGTLLKLQSQMDDIRTSQQTALAKVLSESQMYIVDQMAEASEQTFRAALLGS
jgi:hypothetical protein